MNDEKDLTHEPDGHNGECIYCRGFSYGDAWWREVCEGRVKFERQRILDKPRAIRARIALLEDELKKAEAEAAALKEKTP